MSDFFDFDYYGGNTTPSDSPDARKAINKARRIEDRHAELLRRHEKMALVSQALLELVQERTGITDEELADKILEVDLRDGKADGKISAQVLNCPKCGRKVNSERPVCIFCGTAVATDHLF